MRSEPDLPWDQVLHWDAITFRQIWEATLDDKQRGKTDRQNILAAYLESDLWKANRLIAVTRSKGKCERGCGAVMDEVHHLTYKHLFAEFPEDLLAVCHECHDYLHHPQERADPKDWRRIKQEEFWRKGEAM
jgi:hypothetical protein